MARNVIPYHGANELENFATDGAVYHTINAGMTPLSLSHMRRAYELIPAPRIQSDAPGTTPRQLARQPSRPQTSNQPVVGARFLQREGTRRGDVDEGFSELLLGAYNRIKYQADSNSLTSPDEMRTAVHVIIPLLGDQNGRNWVLSLQGRNAASCIELLDLVVLSQSGNREVQRRALNILERLCSRVELLPRSYIIPSTAVKKIGANPATSGGFADVWRGQYKDQLVALKDIRLSESDDVQKVRKAFIHEVVYWKNLSHPNILPLLGVMIGPPFKFCMMSPWMDNGDVIQYLKIRPNANRLNLLLEIASGVQYLHLMQIVHGDLKGANILIDSGGHACLVDFGLAVVIRTLTTSQTTSTSYTSGGSTRWMAPELFHPERFGAANDRHTKESDIYALSMVMLEIFTGRIPFRGSSDPQVIYQVTNGQRPERPSNATRLGLSDSIWGLMKACWRERYQDRPDIATVVSVIADEVRGAQSR